MPAEITDNGINPAPLGIPQLLQVPTVGGIYAMVQDFLFAVFAYLRSERRASLCLKGCAPGARCSLPNLSPLLIHVLGPLEYSHNPTMYHRVPDVK